MSHPGSLGSSSHCTLMKNFSIWRDFVPLTGSGVQWEQDLEQAVTDGFMFSTSFSRGQSCPVLTEQADPQ